ncbi:MAG: hypothetical protein ACLSVG_00545 [Clostridia bacterium]
MKNIDKYTNNTYNKRVLEWNTLRNRNLPGGGIVAMSSFQSGRRHTFYHLGSGTLDHFALPEMAKPVFLF